MFNSEMSLLQCIQSKFCKSTSWRCFQLNDLNSLTWTRTSKSKSPVNHKNLEQNHYFISKDHQDRPSRRFSQRKLDWLAAKQRSWSLLWLGSLLESQILMFLCRASFNTSLRQTHVSWPSSRGREEKRRRRKPMREISPSFFMEHHEWKAHWRGMCGWDRNRAFVLISPPFRIQVF